MLKKNNCFAGHPILLAIIGFVLILSSYFFIVPIIDCAYAGSLDPLLSNPIKLFLFVVGGLFFWIAAILGGKMVV